VGLLKITEECMKSTALYFYIGFVLGIVVTVVTVLTRGE
jgi:heme/copper-type cytochrome/quinol oxidase subunit 4